MAGKGVTVVNVDYTVAPEANYPTPTKQLAKALAYVESNAAKFGIADRGYVLAGDSAGSQIAAQLANVITSETYAAKVGVRPPVSPDRLKGVLLHCGVYDVSAMKTGNGGVLGWFMRRDARGFETFSVSNYLTPKFPPTFISVGNADPLGPQTMLMERKLREQGVKVESLFFPKNYQPPLGHEYQFDIDTLAGQQALDRSVAWLDQLN
jgi:acetyl esterase